MLAALERGRAVGAQRGVAEVEDMLPLVAEEHRGGELGLHAILAGTRSHAHALEPDHPGTLRAALGARPRAAPELPALALEQRLAVLQLLDLADEAVGSSPEAGGGKRARDRGPFLPRCLPLVHAV